MTKNTLGGERARNGRRGEEPRRARPPPDLRAGLRSGLSTNIQVGTGEGPGDAPHEPPVARRGSVPFA